MSKPDVYILKTQLNGEDALNDAAFATPPVRCCARWTSIRKPRRDDEAQRHGRSAAQQWNRYASSLRGGMVDYFVEEAGVPAERLYVGEASSRLASQAQRDLGWARSGYTEMARESACVCSNWQTTATYALRRATRYSSTTSEFPVGPHLTMYSTSTCPS